LKPFSYGIILHISEVLKIKVFELHLNNIEFEAVGKQFQKYLLNNTPSGYY
jgi:hypothetical protein